MADGLLTRIAAATPPDRDRGVDALRAFAILGVIAGHWLVTAIVRAGDTLELASPLAAMPWLAPVSWALQTLAVFFLVGGYASARSLAPPYGAWLRRRMARLLGPVPMLLAAWIVLGPVLAGLGFSPAALRALATLVISPLWFLAVYALLTALTPVAVWLCRRFGAAAALLPFAVVLLADLGPAWLRWINVVAAWLVPFMLGVAWPRGRRLALALLLGGACATALLIVLPGYPASMVGVPGAPRSNLNPPTLAAVTFGTAQVGLALLARGPLARWMRHPRAWAAVALTNLSALTVFVWHQTALLAVVLAALPFGPLAGLHDQPDGIGWVLARLAWLPVFAAVLLVLVRTRRSA